MSGPYFEPGRYWGRLKQQALGKTSNGNPQIILTFDIVGKINLSDPDGDLLSCPQYERTVFRVITQKTIDWVLQDLEALGFQGTSFGEIDPTQPRFQDLTGKELALYCDHETYEGKTREKWGIYSEGGGLQVKPLEAQDVRKLDAMFGKALKERIPAPPKEPASNPSKAKAAHAASDLPF